jgi:hypothetical protein
MRPNRWEAYRTRQPVRSGVAETVLTTALIGLIGITFGAC